MSASQLQRVLDDGRWIEQTEGSFLEAWKQFWGKPLTTKTQSPHTSWTNALRAKARPTKADNALQQLAQAVLHPSEGRLTLDPCSYIDTPWITELPHTAGKIMVTEDYWRIDEWTEATVNGANGARRGVTIEGQSGIGKTYLAYYLLARQLAQANAVMFSPCNDIFVLFLDTGVYRTDRLTYDWSLGVSCVVPQTAWFIIDRAHDGEHPPHFPIKKHFFPVQICSGLGYPANWPGSGSACNLSFGAPSPYTLLSGALIQADVNGKRAALVQVLRHIHSFGPHPRLCYRALSELGEKQRSLSSYVEGLDVEQGEFMSNLPTRGNLELMRAGDGPNVLAFYWNGANEEGSLIGTVASRYIMGELRQYFGFRSLYGLRTMGSVRQPPDGLHGARHWLFENICHAIISEGRARLDNRDIYRPSDRDSCQLSQCHPPDVEPKDGGLLLEHILQPRTVHVYDDEPLPFDTAAYCIPQFLVGTSFNAVAYVQPFASKKRKTAATATTEGPVTRSAAKRAAQAAAVSSTSERRLTRSAKRRLDDEAANEISSQPPAKKPRLSTKKSDMRFVVFFQMVLQAPPDLTEALPRIQRIMDLNPSARHIMVFVTLPGESLDLNAIPVPWASRLFWYQLKINLSFPRPS